ncbi:hypothetical protein ACFL6H_04900 [Candidatus Latescibacterota bacterium]
MPLLSINDLSQELSISKEVIEDLIKKQIITPHGGRARLGELRFSHKIVPNIRKKIEALFPEKK